MKTFLNFWKGFIRPTHIILMQISKVPDNIKMVNLTFRLSTSDIRRKLQRIRQYIWNDLSQLVDVAFKVFNREQQQIKEDAKQSVIYLALASWKAK